MQPVVMSFSFNNIAISNLHCMLSIAFVYQILIFLSDIQSLQLDTVVFFFVYLFIYYFVYLYQLKLKKNNINQDQKVYTTQRLDGAGYRNSSGIP